MKVKVYGTIGCTICKITKQEIEKKFDVEYKELNHADFAEIAAPFDQLSPPLVIMNNKAYLYSFDQIVGELEKDLVDGEK